MINKFERAYHCIFTAVETDDPIQDSTCHEILITCEEALKLQIPREIKFEPWMDTKCKCGHIFSKHHGDGYHSIPQENKTSYCPDCGQKLDWEAEQ